MQGMQYTSRRAKVTPVRADRASEGKLRQGLGNERTVDREIRVKELHAKLVKSEDYVLKTSEWKRAAYDLQSFSNCTNANAVDNELCWWGTPGPQGEWILEYFEFVKTGARTLHIRVKAKTKPARKGKAKVAQATLPGLE